MSTFSNSFRAETFDRNVMSFFMRRNAEISGNLPGNLLAGCGNSFRKLSSSTPETLSYPNITVGGPVARVEELDIHISHGGGALRLPWLGYGAKRRTLYLGIGWRSIPHCTFYLGMSRGPIPSCTLHLGMSLQPIPRYKVCKGRAY